MSYSAGPEARICMNNDCNNELSQSHSECGYLPNVESTEFQILGSISLSGDPLLSSLQLGAQPVGMPMLSGQAFPGQGTPGQMMPAPMPMAVPQPVPVEQPRPLFGPHTEAMPAPPTPPQP
jgi:hypothetical protein